MRGDYFDFAEDTPPIIFGLIPLNLFVYITSIDCVFPAPILVLCKKNGYTEILWEVCFFLLMLLNTLCTVSYIVQGIHIGIFICMFFGYILLNIRAGGINRENIKLENAQSNN